MDWADAVITLFAENRRAAIVLLLAGGIAGYGAAALLFRERISTLKERIEDYKERLGAKAPNGST